MTDKAKRWLYVYGGLWVLVALFISPNKTPTLEASIYYSVGAFFGSLFVGGLVAAVLRLFRKQDTIYELWFASSAIAMGFYVVVNILELAGVMSPA